MMNLITAETQPGSLGELARPRLAHSVRGCRIPVNTSLQLDCGIPAAAAPATPPRILRYDHAVSNWTNVENRLKVGGNQHDEWNLSVHGYAWNPMSVRCLPKIFSGGQTGVDRAALDAALAQGLICGGWCPQGRMAEDGCLSESYPLRETPLPLYSQRTRWNVRDADLSLVLSAGSIQGGTAYTLRVARALNKGYRVLDLRQPIAPNQVARWLRRVCPRVLNIAGPRESQCLGIYLQAYDYLSVLFRLLGEAETRD